MEKETNTWKTRDQKPDPHIATLTATLRQNEQPLAGQTVTFRWDMPGPAPAETKTATTDGQGKATMDVVSGDELSFVRDDQGTVTYNQPVEITATQGEQEQTASLNVVAARITGRPWK